MKLCRYGLIALIVAASQLPSACSRANVHESLLRDLPDPITTPKILADYQPWFGDPNHIDVGYNSQDPVVLRRQVANARKIGIDAFVVDWYGARQPFLDRSYAILQRIAGEEHFHVALMYDETENDDGHATDDALEAMDLAYKKYIGPGAPGRDAYLTSQGRPIIFVFPKHGNTDWNQVRQQVNQWENPPLLFYENDPPAQYSKDFDGEYPWVFPGSKGWRPDGQPWGEDYLNNFYNKMKNQHSDQIIVGGVWPGFDDSKASWSLHRRIDSRCGQTFEDTLRVFREHDDPSHPIPFVLIATWNDYEEGTAIEPGIPHCNSQSAAKLTTQDSQHE
jgi:hypothetical protein